MAVAGVLAADAAHAVRIGMDGTGQVLLYPYYTTRSGFVTSIAVMNHDFDHTKAVKVRWRESRIGAPVLDINVFLSPRDVWAGVISDDGTEARLTTNDRTCTHPEVPAAGLPFLNTYYTGQVAGTFDDRGGASLDRTREGYIEIIEMGVVANGADADSSPPTPSGNTVAAATRHNVAGSPANCAVVRAAGLFSGAGDLRAPAGRLSGQQVIINSATGTEFALSPTALQQFFRPADRSEDLYTAPGNLGPDLASVQPARSDVIVSETDFSQPLAISVADWVAAGGKPIDAVSAVLMTSEIRGQYDVHPGIKTDLVATMPTKRYYVLPDALPSAQQYAATAPFREAYLRVDTAAGSVQSISCDTHYPFASDRENGPYAVLDGVPLPASPIPRFCYAASVVTIAPSASDGPSSSVFGSRTAHTLTLNANGASGAAPQYTTGWISLAPTRDAATAPSLGPGLELTGGINAVTGMPVTYSTYVAGGLRNLAPVHTDGVARRYRGLPVIGFTAISATASGQGYGGIFPINTSTRTTP